MEINFVTQPWADSGNLDIFLGDVSEDTELRSITMAVAWAKRSAFSRIRAHLELMRSRGAQINLIVGISAGGATRQGLELAQELADTVFIVHDPQGRTFHPKVYLAESDLFDRIFVGSNNLTAGGLFFNYEAGVRVDIPHDPEETHPVLGQVKTWFERLRNDSAICRPLTPEVLEKLLADPRYRIGDEDQRITPGNEDSHDFPEDSDSEQDQDQHEGDQLFSASSHPMRHSKFAPSKDSTGGTTAPIVKKSAAKSLGASTNAGKPSIAVSTARWTKVLKSSDAQQPSIGSQPTGNLRLSQSGHPIDHKTYFRNDFFGSESWSIDKAKPEVEFAFVDFYVSIHGASLGIHKLRVDHNVNRIAGQNNVATVLKWGDLNVNLRTHSHIDDIVTIDRLDDGTYSLDIS